MRRIVLFIALSLIGGCADVASQTPTVSQPSPTAAAPSATGDCATLAALTPSRAAPLELVDLGDGTRRVTSAEGGYSLVVPSEWRASAGWSGGPALFGQAHFTSYDPAAIPTPRPEAGNILPPEVGIRFDIEVWADPFGETPEAYGKRIQIGPDQVAIVPGGTVTVGSHQAHRMRIQDERRFQPSDAPLITTRQTRAVWIVPSPRRDRKLVLYATPAESTLLPIVERALTSLVVTHPTQTARPVTRQRSDVLREWLVDKSGSAIPGRRAEAKLLTYAESFSAFQPIPPVGAPAPPVPMGILRIDRDPEDLVWVVAISGPDLPFVPRRGPAGTGTPVPAAWVLMQVQATDDRPSVGGGMQMSTSGTWPPTFDQLPDRCH